MTPEQHNHHALTWWWARNANRHIWAWRAWMARKTYDESPYRLGVKQGNAIIAEKRDVSRHEV